jgi:hypothetical protein
MWSVANTYVRYNRHVQQFLDRVGKPYILLPPPVVSVPLLVLDAEPYATVFDNEFASWSSTGKVIDAEELRSRVPDQIENCDSLPSREELMRVKWFSYATMSAVMLYQAETWGGTTEYEWCWLFDRGQHERVLLYAIRSEPLPESSVRSPRRSEPLILRVTEDQVAEERIRFPLQLFSMAAEYLGVSAPGGLFEPHRRGFNLNDYLARPSEGE